MSFYPRQKDMGRDGNGHLREGYSPAAYGDPGDASRGEGVLCLCRLATTRPSDQDNHDCFWVPRSEEASMGVLIAYGLATTAFVKGVLIGLAIGGAVTACACRKARPAERRERREEPQPEA